jgi:hypothetical protein
MSRNCLNIWNVSRLSEVQFKYRLNYPDKTASPVGQLTITHTREILVVAELGRLVPEPICKMASQNRKETSDL